MQSVQILLGSTFFNLHCSIAMVIANIFAWVLESATKEIDPAKSIDHELVTTSKPTPHKG